jgi:hypothetical protein
MDSVLKRIKEEEGGRSVEIKKTDVMEKKEVK